MKYLRKYKTAYDEENDLKYNQEFPFPSVAYLENEKEVVYLKEPIHNEPLYVDLGLPSGTLWGRWNVGAEYTDETRWDNFGLYFKWGETVGYKTQEECEAATYKFNPSGDNTTFTKYNETDGLKTLELEDDPVHAIMGFDWRLPTDEQCKELLENISGVYSDYTSNINGKKIYIPHRDGVPCFWSSTLNEEKVNSAHLIGGWHERLVRNTYDRWIPCPIRGVINVKK